MQPCVIKHSPRWDACANMSCQLSTAWSAAGQYMLAHFIAQNSMVRSPRQESVLSLESHRSLCWWISTIFAWHCNNGHLWISDRTMLIFADGNVCNILAISRLIFCELLWRQSFRIEEGHNISRPDHDMRLDHARERDDPRGWFTLFTFSSGIKKWWQKLCLDSAPEREMAHENAIHIVSFLFPDACQPSTTLRTKHSCLYRSKNLKKDKIEYFSLLWIQIWIFQWLC